MEQTECIHYWIIEPANGPVSSGTCKLCSETKDFDNTIYLDKKDAKNLNLKPREREQLLEE